MPRSPEARVPASPPPDLHPSQLKWLFFLPVIIPPRPKPHLGGGGRNGVPCRRGARMSEQMLRVAAQTLFFPWDPQSGSHLLSHLCLWSRQLAEVTAGGNAQAWHPVPGHPTVTVNPRWPRVPALASRPHQGAQAPHSDCAVDKGRWAFTPCALGARGSFGRASRVGVLG